MSVPKRLRFEILRRDNFTCRYCGASAPDVHLTVDHVLPVALGGTDDPTNLVAACRDCNAGKSSINPDQPLVDQVSEDAIRWARAITVASQAMSESVRTAAKYRRDIYKAWREWDDDARFLPSDAEMMCGYWHRIGIPVSVVVDAIDIAWSREHIRPRDVWRYTNGIMKNRIRDIEEYAHSLIEAGEI